ncbi:putative XRE family transcriptional regulators [Candidatus Termititenax aidoneus]|uniref:XRE family transcriptional regulators n=1 Tax=Termititenax aidoneus TaxID=2218524 RepID=A0A388TAI4_TERA1|nr:putative XRE family transcriptional regulators [Candidatus Termititenax aidoneus]
MNDIKQLKEHIGQRLKDLRINKGLTLEDICFELDISFSSYLYIEKGTRHTPRLEMLCKLADFYDLPVNYFFQDYSPQHQPQKNTLEKRLLLDFRRLTADKKNLALRVLKVLP